MAITSGGKSYNPSFPVANVNNNSKGFRDNFATIKFAIESLQVAQTGGAVAGGLTSNGSILKLTASPDNTNGAIVLRAEFNSTGFRLPVNRPGSPAAGMICYENGVLYFHNGSVWQTFIERVGDTVTLPNIVVTTKLTLNYAPTAPTDAVTVQWVQNYIAGLPSAGMDPVIYTRLDNLESELADEIELRASEDTAIRALITTERNRINAHDLQFTQIGQQITQVNNDLNTRMDAVEDLAGQVSADFSALNQEVDAAVQQINDLSGQVETDITGERDARIAADNALSARIDTINNTALPALTASVTAERDARIAADNLLQQNINTGATALNTERDARIAQADVQNNTIAALADTVTQTNTVVLTMDGRVNTVAADILAERNNRIVGDQALGTRIDNEQAARIAADNALGVRIDNEATARGQAVSSEAAARIAADNALGIRIDNEVTARQQADTSITGALVTEVADRQQADQTLQSNINAEATARNNAIAAETTARQNAVSAEATARSDADTALDARIDALEASSGATNDYLDKSDGGTITGPVTISNTTFTLQNSTLELPGSDIKLDASKALLFTKLPNTTGVGDGGFVTFDENNFRYAYLDGGAPTGPERDAAVAAGNAASEFACLRVGSTNDPTGGAADSVAIEPSAHLYLNPGWAGTSTTEGALRAPSPGSIVFVGDAVSWTVSMDRDSGDIATKGSITADGNITGLSDASVKENVDRITGALDKIEALTGVLYNRTDIAERPRHMGLIAQDTQKIVPEVVEERYDGKLSIAYGNLIGLLVEGIKELRAEVRALKQ